MMEVLGVVQGIDYLDRNLRRFMRPIRRHIALHQRMGSNHIEYQPLGVVGVISPWNYPVNLSLMPVVTAIAAGNRVMLKPSKFTPATNAVIASMISEIFPEDQVTVVDGDGAAFSSLPFDHLVFTGSSAVGRSVMKAASENLVPVTLELGGKSPTIVAKGHVHDRAVSVHRLRQAPQRRADLHRPRLRPGSRVGGRRLRQHLRQARQGRLPRRPDEQGLHLDRQRQAVRDPGRPHRGRPRPRRADHRGRTPARGCRPAPPHIRAHGRARRHRRDEDRPRGDLRADPADLRPTARSTRPSTT